LLTRVDIQNYRSIYNASVPLSPFTLLIGVNGAGKSNFLKLLKDAASAGSKNRATFPESKHYSYSSEDQLILIYNDQDQLYQVTQGDRHPTDLSELRDVKVFSLDPQKAGSHETLVSQPTIREDGSGVVQVLDSLKTGDREDLFNQIETIFKHHIPEVEKLSFIPVSNAKKLQVRERCLPAPVLIESLSEGTRLALMLIAILHQERKPSLVCIEDIDRGLHPRLFQSIVELCFDLSQGPEGVQIIATTHNPYLVDEFQGHEEAVVIVEKNEGQTQFTTLAEKLEAIEPIEEPLGSLWYSGVVGGVPQRV